MAETEIKFGVMCRSTTLANWQANAIKDLLELQNVKCDLLILEEGQEKSFLKKVLELFKFKNILWLTYLFVFKKKIRSSQKIDLADLLANAARMRCGVTKKGQFSEYFKSSDIEEIKNHDLDFILRFGFGILRGEILDSAKYGVWSFHHGDEQKYRGSPPGFWEIYNNDGVTGAILQKLTDRLDAGIVLKKGYLKTKYSYIKNRDQLYKESSRWPANLCIDIMNGQTEKFEAKPSETAAPVYYKPTNTQFIIFIIRSLFYRCKEQFKKVFYTDYWNIGIARGDISEFLKEEKPEIEWFPLKTKEKFIADAFGVSDGSEDLHIFYETYPFKENKGRIDYSSYNEGFSLSSQTVLNEDFHLSYPYVFSHDGSFYMIPESFVDNNITIYRATNFPLEWEKQAILIEDFKGIDTTLLKHEGIWWLFTSDKDDGPHHNLKLFYSDNLFSGWKPHPKNPVKTDIRSARCAGTPFIYKGDLIRPSMDYSEKIEGRITLNKIVMLSKNDFREIAIKTIDPYINSIFPDKIHTLSAAGKYTVVDGCKESLIFSDVNFFKSKISRLVKSIS